MIDMTLHRFAKTRQQQFNPKYQKPETWERAVKVAKSYPGRCLWCDSRAKFVLKTKHFPLNGRSRNYCAAHARELPKSLRPDGSGPREQALKGDGA